MITVDAFEWVDTPALNNLGPLGSAEQVEWVDDLRDTGSFSLTIKAGHADEGLCADGRYLRFSINGTPRWWGVIERRSKVSADPNGRESGRVITISGRGTLSLLEDAPLLPERGLGRLSPETRYLNFASLDFDDSGWGNAVELKQQNDPDMTKPWWNAPKDWPDPSAFWVGPTAGDTPPVAPGDIYLRGTLTVAVGEGSEYRFYLTADDGFELYVDGNKIAAEQAAGLWGETRYVDVLLDEGSHLVAVKAINFDRPNPATNVFGFIMTVVKLLDGGQQYGLVVGRTSSGTKMLAFPAAAPGMTPGKLLTTLLGEAFTAGYLLPFDYNFTETDDSDATAWPTEYDEAFPVGTSNLEILRKLISEKALDVWMDPAPTDFLTMNGYVSKGSDLSGSVSVTYGTNVGELGHDRTPPGPNTLLLRTSEGKYVQVERTASVTSWGRRGLFMSFGSAPSDDAATRQANAYLDDHAEPADVITQVRIEPSSSVPYVDFSTGDSITAPKFDGSSGVFRVTGIRVTADAAGNPQYDLDLEAA